MSKRSVVELQARIQQLCKQRSAHRRQIRQLQKALALQKALLENHFLLKENRSLREKQKEAVSA